MVGASIGHRTPGEPFQRRAMQRLDQHPLKGRVIPLILKKSGEAGFDGA